MVEKDRWERMWKWARGGDLEPEGYVPSWVAKATPPVAASAPAQIQDDQRQLDLIRDGQEGE